METANNTQAATQVKKADSALIKPTDLLVKQPAVNPVADKALQAAVDTVTGADSADEVGTDIGVEDEISYVVAEGTANAELASASGLFGGLVGSGIGPGALGLAALGLLGGGGGGGGGETPDGNTTATGVVGATEAAADGVSTTPAAPLGTVIAGDPNNPNDGASGSIDSGSEMLTGNLPGAAGAGSEAVIGNTDAAADANGNAIAPDQNFGIIGGLEAGGAPAAAQEPFVQIRDGIAGSPVNTAPGGTSLVEGTNDTLGSSTTNPVGGTTTAASAGNDLPVEDILASGTSAITSSADTLSSGQLPLPPAV